MSSICGRVLFSLFATTVSQNDNSLLIPPQGHFNVSVRQDPEGIWTATVDTDLEGKRAFLRLNARAWPELSVEGELIHNAAALRGLPEHSRLRVTSRAGNRRYDTDALIQMDDCAVCASGAVMSQSGLQGSVVYYNNCTLIQVQIPLNAVFNHSHRILITYQI